MKTRPFLVLLFAGFGLPATLGAGGISVSFADAENFEDFTLHELRSTEDARIIFERQLAEYWDRRLEALLPDGWGLSLHFTEIDMAGDIQPWRHPANKTIRYYENRFYPRLFFDYVITDAQGEQVRSGHAKVKDTNFDFGGPGRIIRDEFVFGYELEAIRKWLRKLDLRKTTETD